MADGGCGLKRVPFVDAHAHHWDPAKPEWYPFLSPSGDLPEMGLGDIAAMKRVYDQHTYLTEAVPWQVTGYVHVSAATAVGMHLHETRMLAELYRTTGSPGAVIGAINPADSLSDIERELDRQLEWPCFRGVRVFDEVNYDSAHTVRFLQLLAERGLIYDLHISPRLITSALRAIEKVPDLSVVVEHCAGANSVDISSARKVWKDGVCALAQRDLTAIKFSGLAMIQHGYSTEKFRPWFECIVDAFGSTRTLIGSNFPVDGLYGTLPDLLDAYLELALPLGLEAVADLFAENARRIYLRPSVFSAEVDAE